MKELSRINKKLTSEHRSDEGDLIGAYSELLHKVGAIQNFLPKYMVYFRGQTLLN
jgi:hypothetical protein